ncbi:MAG TPA: MauE/DoxX family redox-associated membrane protein [Micromonosporaceae bacterium]|nr:MauE/DoxX family redox-associated membrane protein [Micromonosporaceae bacterium]
MIVTDVSYIVVGCQAVLAVTFATAAAGKLRRPAGFRRTLTAALHIRWPRTAVVATVVAVGEAATALAVAVVPAAGFVLAAALLVGFTAVLVSMIRRGLAVPCRCFGASERPPGAAHIVRNAVLFAVAAAGGALALTGTGPRAGAPAWLLAALLGVAAALVLIYLDDVVALAEPVR